MGQNLYNDQFSHIYVERKVFDHFRTRKILDRFPKSRVIPIEHYKDVFNRKHQNFRLQHESLSLILASLEGESIYKGAPVCQAFDNSYFYYTSNVMNCPFDCQYCYLKGMYPSGNMVIFVNLEDIFSQLEEMLKAHPVYLCVSYDTDLLALESITGFVKEWCDFTLNHPDLKIEIRTKSSRRDIYDETAPSDRVIFAYTLSPDYVCEHYEQGAAGPTDRIKAAAYALEKGFKVRLCFDPMIICPNWKEEYERLLNSTAEVIDLETLTDVSVGSFRISQDYMKQMRRNFPYSPVAQFPYINVDGFYQYPETVRSSMEDFIKAGLEKYIPAERIYFWKE